MDGGDSYVNIVSAVTWLFTLVNATSFTGNQFFVQDWLCKQTFVVSVFYRYCASC